MRPPERLQSAWQKYVYGDGLLDLARIEGFVANRNGARMRRVPMATPLRF
jgi:hypothetical protein